jgi:hypothetical protein
VNHWTELQPAFFDSVVPIPEADKEDVKAKENLQTL